ncbi:MAG TPA: hypothetical protein VF533_11360 [Solirubrobacteraceae bacterium]|jgi:hypothetical protein
MRLGRITQAMTRASRRVTRASGIGFVMMLAATGSPSSAGASNGAPSFDADERTEMRDRGRARAASAGSDEAKAERAVSRSAHRELNDAAALQADALTHPKIARGKVWTGLEVHPGEGVERFLGNFGARIDRGEGERPALVESTLPLSVLGDDGRRRPVDLSLQPGWNSYSPASSAAGIVFPRALGDGMRLSDAGLKVTPVVARPDGAPVVEDARLSWANVEVDTDFAVTPTPAGFETVHFLRSPASPEQLRFRVELPSGAEMRPVPAEQHAPEGTIEVVRGDIVLATISAPVAWDAQQTSVKVDTRVVGANVVMDVAHRDRDVAYPVVVDPVIEDGILVENQQFWDQDPSKERGWTYSSRGPVYSNHTGYWQAARYFQTYAGWLTDGDFGRATFRAPGNSRIIEAHFNHVRGQYLLADQGGACTTVGMWLNGWQRFDNFNGCTLNFENANVIFTTSGSGDRGPGPYYGWRYGDYTNIDGNEARFEHDVWGSWTRPTHGVSTLGGALFRLDDLHAPDKVEVAPAWGADGWVESGEGRADITATDQGLGIQRLSLFVPRRDGSAPIERFATFGSGTDDKPATWWCLGIQADPCAKAPPTWGIGYNVDELPDGKNKLRAKAYDALGTADGPLGTPENPINASLSTDAPTWTVDVDRKAPNAPTMSGNLWTGRAAPITGMPTLNVTARDGATGNPASAANSGIASVALRVDGSATPFVHPAACAGQDSCAVTNEPFTPTLSDGEHTLQVIVKDALGHTTPSAPWTVTIDQTPAAITSIPVHTPGLASGAWQTATARTVTLNGSNTGTGVKRFDVTTPSGTFSKAMTCASVYDCPTPTSATDVDYRVPEGKSAVSAVAVDPFERASAAKPWTTRVDISDPVVKLGGSIATSRNQIFKSNTGQLTVDATDGNPAGPDSARRSGVKSIEVWVDDQLQAPTTTQPLPQACPYSDSTGVARTSPDSCPLKRVYQYDEPDGAHTIKVSVKDFVGNDWEDSWTIVNDLIDPILAPLRHDPDPPPSDWIDIYSANVSGDAVDAGAGLHRMELTEPLKPPAGAPNTDSGDRTQTQRFQNALTGADCQGTLTNMCPPSGSKRFSYTTTNYREGYVTPKVEAVDAAGRRSEPGSWQLKVDHSAPVITSAGAASAFDGKAITATGTYGLDVNASDGVRGGTPSQQESGVATLQLDLLKNGVGTYQPVAAADTSDCTGDSCEGATSYMVDTAALGDGLHTIRMTAKDRLWERVPDAYKARHVSVRYFKFYVDLNPPTLDPLTHDPALPTGWIDAVDLSATAVARDAGSGVKSLTLVKGTPSGIVYDIRPMQSTSGTDCVLSTDLTKRCPKVTPATRLAYNSGELREGSAVRPYVRASDAVGRFSAVSIWSLKIDHSAPEVASLAGPLFDRKEAVPYDDASISVTASDGVYGGTESQQRSGVNRIDVFVDEELQPDDGQQACPESSCSLTRRFELDTGRYSDGRSHQVRVEAVDQLGHRSASREWTVLLDYAHDDDKIEPGDDGSDSDDYGDGDDLSYCTPDASGSTADCDESVPDNDAESEAVQEPALNRFSTSTPAATVAPGLVQGGSGYGIADQHFETFSHPSFAALGLTRARILVPWDVVARGDADQVYKQRTIAGTEETLIARADRETRDRLDAWMLKVSDMHIRPLISFNKTSGEEFARYLPTLNQYRAGVQAFMARYNALPYDKNTGDGIPFVGAYTAWNEPNQRAQPTAAAFDYWYRRNGAFSAGRFWRVLRAMCKDTGCTVAAGEFLEARAKNLKKYISDYKDGAFRSKDADGLRAQRPRIWAWHAYSSGLHRSRSRLRGFFKVTRRKDTSKQPAIWLTEQGAYVQQPQREKGPRVAGDPAASEREAQVDMGVLLDLPSTKVPTGASDSEAEWNTGDRIKRFYYYQYFGEGPFGQKLPNGRYKHDTGLIRPPDIGGNPRSLYDLYRQRTCPKGPAAGCV